MKRAMAFVVVLGVVACGSTAADAAKPGFKDCASVAGVRDLEIGPKRRSCEVARVVARNWVRTTRCDPNGRASQDHTLHLARAMGAAVRRRSGRSHITCNARATSGIRCRAIRSRRWSRSTGQADGETCAARRRRPSRVRLRASLPLGRRGVVRIAQPIPPERRSPCALSSWPWCVAVFVVAVPSVAGAKSVTKCNLPQLGVRPGVPGRVHRQGPSEEPPALHRWRREAMPRRRSGGACFTGSERA